jgi:hypothetical protein
VAHRADGGGHEALNIVLLCSACHLAHHRGKLTITGTADQLEVRRPGQAEFPADAHDLPIAVTAVTGAAVTAAHVGTASKLEAAILHTQAKAALTGLGWKPAIAHAAIAAAVASAQGVEVTLERLIFESLRRCPAPRA